jgi:succinate dehydrogenase (ubiquinone) membrane anchor subunit
LPPLPQTIVGTTNDPVPVPDPDYTHGSYHWSFERCVALMPRMLRPVHSSIIGTLHWDTHMLMLV